MAKSENQNALKISIQISGTYDAARRRKVSSTQTFGAET